MQVVGINRLARDQRVSHEGREILQSAAARPKESFSSADATELFTLRVSVDGVYLQRVLIGFV